MKRGIKNLIFIWGCIILLMTGCAKTIPVNTESHEHEKITMQAPFRNISAFIDVLHDKYPEIQIEVIPYSGANYTAYVNAQLKAGDMPDIYCTTFYRPAYSNVSDKLIDLSGYAFTDNYAQARLREVTDDGAVYMLPTYYDCIGITYNKTLLENNGWELPQSFKELEELAPKVKAAGYNLAVNQIQLPGYGFQYMCNILDTSFFNTPEGVQWQRDYLNGNIKLKDSPEMIKNMYQLDRWREIGMLNASGNATSDDDTRLMMAQGKTLFMLGSCNVFSEEETSDEFGIMPFLSEDGTQNAFILNVSRYMGINKKLEDNEQKLNDALHVMEVLSTVEGMQALNSDYANTSLLPLRDYDVNSEGYYADIEDELNAGITAPFIYAGWEDLIVPIGNVMISYIKGERSIDDVIEAFDENQYLLEDKSSTVYTYVKEKINNDYCARLVGICFAKACDADLALISKNKWYKNVTDLNLEGVSGELYPLPVTEQEITSILPTGWKGNIITVKLDGYTIKKLVESGYDRNGDGNTFPYELVMQEGFEIDDDTVYIVAVAGVTDEIAQKGGVTDTGICGLDAAKEYFNGFDTLSESDIIWE
ncbi:MAG: extracellular solute-binding protein [Lachnospiraceae bacterium]|nr:extracellular solute-binding protein [Lachnospiraceae bacterium]